MRRFLIKVGAVLFAIAGLVAILWPVNNWRMYDANWAPLAMTDAESYCSGWVLGDTNFVNKENKQAIQDCLDRVEYDNTQPHIGASVQLACIGLFETQAWPVNDCVQLIEGYEVWFLQWGGYTWEWNDAHPRPQVYKTNIVEAPSREDRAEDGRNSTGRMVP